LLSLPKTTTLLRILTPTSLEWRTTVGKQDGERYSTVSREC
jgi:hypothetical protein